MYIYIISIDSIKDTYMISTSPSKFDLKESLRSMDNFLPGKPTLLIKRKSKDAESIKRLIHFRWKNRAIYNDWYYFDSNEIEDVIRSIPEARKIYTSFLSEYIDDYIHFVDGKPVMNDYFCNKVKKDLNQDIDNRKIIRAVESYCVLNGWKMERGRAHSGRFFIIHK